MKTLLTFIMSVLLLNGALFAQNVSFADTVLPWMYESGLTKYNTVDSFRPAAHITRGEASKFVSKYGEVI